MTFAKSLPTALLAALAAAGGALGQTANPASGYSGDFERPYGFAYGQETQAFDAGTRDSNGNRVIVDGRIYTGDVSTLSSGVFGGSAWMQSGYGATGLGYGASNGQAVGNQLNIITQGSNNTIVVDSTQINNGNQTAILNGGINLDD